LNGSKKITILHPAAYLFAALLCCINLLAHAQSPTFILHGVVFKKGTSSERVAKVLVANLNNNSIVNTDGLGSFEIRCAIGDSLIFRQKDYADQKIGIITANALMVYLQPVINLSEVNIREASKKQELQQVMKEYNSQGVYANGSPSVASAILNPINGLYDLFGGKPQQARRFKEYSEHELEQQEVDRRYTKTLVQKITTLPDEKVKAFMESFRPSYEDIKKWNDYDLIAYIKRSYKFYEENGERSTEQKLY
jgi:hypothetical protein